LKEEKMSEEKRHTIQIGRGVHSKPGTLNIVYLNNYRVLGGKPWGGFVAEHTYVISDDDLRTAIKS
jgi:hypothetical protein